MFANPDGTFTAEISRLPVRANTGTVWVDVDPTLTRQPDGGITPKASALPMRFSNGGTDPLAIIGPAGSQITFAWPGNLPTPTLDANQATYPNVLPGVDLVITADPNRFREVLVVKTATAALDPLLQQLEFATTSDTRLTDSPTGQTANRTGQPLLRASEPIMWESRIDTHLGAAPTAAEPGSGRITRLQSALTGDTTVPRSPLTLSITVPNPSPQTTYPLYIDPSFEDSRDHWLTVASGGMWWYDDTSETALRVGYCGWAGCDSIGTTRSYFSMTTTTISGRPTTAKIFAATIYATQIHNADCSPQPVNLWTAGAVTTNTRWPGPLHDNLMQITSNAGAACTTTKSKTLAFNNANVIAAVQEGATYDRTNLTWALIAPNESNALQWKKFDLNPSLVVTYNYPPNPATNLAITGATTCNGTTRTTTHTPTLNARATDNNPSPLQPALWFEITAAGNTTTLAKNTTPIRINSGNNGTWTTTPPVADGSYTFRVKVDNIPETTNHQFDQWATTNTALNFTIDTTPPTPPTITSTDYPPPATPGPTPNNLGTITLTNPTTDDIAGFTYTWDDPTAIRNPTPTTCNENATWTRTDGTPGGGITSTTTSTNTVQVPTNLAPGTHTFTAHAFDQAHNTSTQSTFNFTVAG